MNKTTIEKRETMDLSKLKPLHDRVIVKRDEQDEKTPGGIIVPDTAQKQLTRGTVIAVGPGKVLDNGKFRETNVKTGDHVLFGKYSGNELPEDHQIMPEDEIYGIIED